MPSRSGGRRKLVPAFVALLGTAAACGAAGTVTTDVPTPECQVYVGAGEIPPPPDGASLCPAGPCNYQTQAGCSAGQACVVNMDTKTKTVAPVCRAAGTLGRGEACGDPDAGAGADITCAKGLLCISNVCRKLCCGSDWSACDPGESCVRQLQVAFDKNTTVDVGVDFCVPVNNCDVLDSTACAAENRTCRVVDPTGAVGCAPASASAVGDPCNEPSQCGAGLLCVLPLDQSGPSVQGTCRKLCEWAACGSSPACSKEEGTCVRFKRDPAGVGECVPGWEGPPLERDGGAFADAGK